MPNPSQTDLLDGMIARLEEANTKAYEQLARADDGLLNSEPSYHLDQQTPATVPKRHSSHAAPVFLVLIALGLAASASITFLAWKPSYGGAAKLIIVRWANAWGSQAIPLASIAPQDSPSPAPPISPKSGELLLQRIADDQAGLEHRVEQLEFSYDQIIRGHAKVNEQFEASQEQAARDHAKVVEELNAALAQIARHDAEVADQLKTTQERLAEVEASQLATSARKPIRRKPVSILPSPQKRPRSQKPIH
jgi:uncharacterized coiled-coil protein SlyX